MAMSGFVQSGQTMSTVFPPVPLVRSANQEAVPEAGLAAPP